MSEKGSLNFFQRLIKIFVSPSEVFASIKEKPKILFPFIYVFVISIVTGILQKPMAELQQRELQDLYLERYGMDMSALSQKGLGDGSSLLLTVGSIFIGLWIAWLIVSVILLLVSKILKGDANYKQLLSLEVHIGMLTSTLALVFTPIDLLLKNTYTVFSLSIFYPGGNMTSLVYNILSAMTLFSFWALILRGMGLYALNNFSKIKGYVTSVVLYIVSILLTAGSAKMSFWIFDMLYKSGNM